MKNSIGIVMVYLFLSGCVSIGISDSRIRTLIRDSSSLADNLNKGYYDKVARLTHPKVVQAVGGHQELEKILKKSLYPIIRNGQWGGIKFDHPAEIKNIDGNLYSVVQNQLKIDIRNLIYYLDSYYLAMSTDKGLTWRFTDGGELYKPGFLEWLIPGYDNELNIPKKKEAYLKPGKL